MVEVTDEEQAEKVQNFLEDTKKMLDRYFAELGYICFVFNKKRNKGESVYVTNSPNDVASIVQPFANAEAIEANRARKTFLRDARKK